VFTTQATRTHVIDIACWPHLRGARSFASSPAPHSSASHPRCNYYAPAGGTLHTRKSACPRLTASMAACLPDGHLRMKGKRTSGIVAHRGVLPGIEELSRNMTVIRSADSKRGSVTEPRLNPDNLGGKGEFYFQQMCEHHF
jgi:hypothetical protein